ncbi:MAG: DUF2318 domain-containing protein [Synergistaceae bacterium]|nr:DUF2318 domain-containing protein [Synergistaceae bacterium]
MAGNQNQSKSKKNKWLLPVAAVTVLAVVLTIGAIQAMRSGTSNNDSASGNRANVSRVISQVINEGESLVIPIGEISETANFYPLTVGGTRMEVIAVTAPDGMNRTALNTCQICNGSPDAYFVQRGNTLECQACGNRFPMSRVGIVAGGCNPVPIFDADRTVTAESITVSYEFLQANANRFSPNWKTQ